MNFGNNVFTDSITHENSYHIGVPFFLDENVIISTEDMYDVLSIIRNMKTRIEKLEKEADEARPIIRDHRNKAVEKIQSWYRWHFHLKPNAIITRKLRDRFQNNNYKSLSQMTPEQIRNN